MTTMPSLAGATRRINSQPLGRTELSGHVVLVNFWTLTCVNWLRTASYLRAWSEACTCAPIRASSEETAPTAVTPVNVLTARGRS